MSQFSMTTLARTPVGVCQPAAPNMAISISCIQAEIIDLLGAFFPRNAFSCVCIL
jgi:hypothetical protein